MTKQEQEAVPDFPIKFVPYMPSIYSIDGAETAKASGATCDHRSSSRFPEHFVRLRVPTGLVLYSVESSPASLSPGFPCSPNLPETIALLAIAPCAAFQPAEANIEFATFVHMRL